MNATCARKANTRRKRDKQAAVNATLQICSRNMRYKTSIGRPLPHVACYVLVPRGRESQPIGVPGELCCAGVHVARGYLNRPEKTAECFVENPCFDAGRDDVPELIRM